MQPGIDLARAGSEAETAVPSQSEMSQYTQVQHDQGGFVSADVAAQASAEASTSGVAGQPKPKPILQNFVATCNMGSTVDLKHLARSARNCEYNPKRFTAAILRVREPKTTALIFRSGKIVVTGAKTEDGCWRAARKYGRIIQQSSKGQGKRYDQIFDFKVQNVVASCDVRFPIRLEGLVRSHANHAHYEPELFPGLIYHLKEPKVTLLVFVSGKVVMTGARSPKAIYEAFDQMYDILRAFNKSKSSQPSEDTTASI